LIFLRGRLENGLASSVTAELLLAAHLPGASPPELYIDSPGGSITAALALYDVMRMPPAGVATVCTGVAGGAAVLVLAAGAPSRRTALPNARVHLTDDIVDLAPARFDHPQVEAEEARRATARWRSALIQVVRQAPEQLAIDMAAGRWLTAAEAVEYGIVDRIHS
jgi:ATP-dependent Clp protease, protease subunit